MFYLIPRTKLLENKYASGPDVEPIKFTNINHESIFYEFIDETAWSYGSKLDHYYIKWPLQLFLFAGLY